MDLYQDNDVDMINFLLSKNLINKQQILECIEKVFSWQQQGSNFASNEENEPNSAQVSELKLNLTHSYPTNLEELDAYLNFKTELNEAESSDDNEELK